MAFGVLERQTDRPASAGHPLAQPGVGVEVVAAVVAPAQPPRRAISLVVAALVVLNVGATLLEPALLRLARHSVQPSTAQIVVYHDSPRPDLVFMGSSRALYGLDPMVAEAEIASETGASVRAINLAIAAGATDLNYLILKNVIRPEKQPKVIVYGLAEFELLRVPGYDPGTFPFFPLVLRFDDYPLYSGRTFEDKARFVADRLLPLYRDRDLIRQGLSVALNPDDPVHDSYVLPPEQSYLDTDGFMSWPPNLPLSAAAEEASRRGMQAYLRAFQFDQFRLSRLHDFLVLAHARGIQVILVNMPVTPAMRGLWGDDESIDRFTRVVGDEARSQGVPFVDLYRDSEQQFPTTSFFDDHHLNRAGAAVATRLLAQRYLADEFRGSTGAVQ